MKTIIVKDFDKIYQMHLSTHMPEKFIFKKINIIFGTYSIKLKTKIKTRKDTSEKYMLAEIRDLSDTHIVEINLDKDNYFSGITLIDTTHTNCDKAGWRCLDPAEMSIAICNYIRSTINNAIIVY